MNPLSIVFIFKIAATLVFWCMPLLVFPSSLLEALGVPTQPHILFLRLLGWAYLALCAGYAFGLRSALRGVRPDGPVWMGIVSNGGAAILLFLYGISGAWSHFGPPLNALLWASAFATAGITAGLIRFGIGPSVRSGKE